MCVFYCYSLGKDVRAHLFSVHLYCSLMRELLPPSPVIWCSCFSADVQQVYRAEIICDSTRLPVGFLWQLFGKSKCLEVCLFNFSWRCCWFVQYLSLFSLRTCRKLSGMSRSLCDFAMSRYCLTWVRIAWKNENACSWLEWTFQKRAS